MNKTEYVNELFSEGYNCAQSVFATFAEDYGLNKEMALKIASCLGGGVRCGEICGAVTGAALVIGLRHGYTSPNDFEAKELCSNEINTFTQHFQGNHGTLICRDILGVDISDDEGSKFATDHNLFHTVCVDMVKSAAEMLEDMGY